MYFCKKKIKVIIINIEPIKFCYYFVVVLTINFLLTNLLIETDICFLQLFYTIYFFISIGYGSGVSIFSKLIAFKTNFEINNF